MLIGIERPAKTRTPGASSAASSPRFALNLPTAAGFALAFGLTGYLLTRYTTLAPAVDLVIAVAAGALGAVGALTLLAAWAIPAAKAEVVDARYVMQGAFARVIGVSDRGTSGMVTYESEGVSHTSRATAIDGARLEVGSDVVIERIEDGIAYVEPWAQVESRL
jgi:membrane protein implicated in regulation of membrane protease activity